ncbi:hypothetical protein ACWC5G_18460, partial [Streptomyces sp. NPDC001274]
MRSSGDGTAAGGSYSQQGSTADRTVVQPVQPAVAGGAVASADDIGYRGPTACAAAGITYRQLDYWARTGLVEPSVRPAYGSATPPVTSAPGSRASSPDTAEPGATSRSPGTW